MSRTNRLVCELRQEGARVWVHSTLDGCELNDRVVYSNTDIKEGEPIARAIYDGRLRLTEDSRLVDIFGVDHRESDEWKD